MADLAELRVLQCLNSLPENRRLEFQMAFQAQKKRTARQQLKQHPDSAIRDLNERFRAHCRSVTSPSSVERSLGMTAVFDCRRWCIGSPDGSSPHVMWFPVEQCIAPGLSAPSLDSSCRKCDLFLDLPRAIVHLAGIMLRTGLQSSIWNRDCDAKRSYAHVATLAQGPIM